MQFLSGKKIIFALKAYLHYRSKAAVHNLGYANFSAASDLSKYFQWNDILHDFLEITNRHESFIFLLGEFEYKKVGQYNKK